MALQKMDIVDINLNTGNIHRSFLNHSIGQKDAGADRFGIRTFRDGVPVDLSGCSCHAWFMNSQGTTLALTDYGTIDGNLAYVSLPSACYDYAGQFTLAIKIINGNLEETLRIVDGVVDNINTGGAVSPTSQIPDYSQILSVYSDMLSATSAANTAIAETFDATKNYPEGKNVINSGALYLLPEGHIENTTWANTTKVASNLGDQVTDLKSEITIIENDNRSFSGNLENGYCIADQSSATKVKIDYARYRVVTSNPVHIKKNCTINVDSGYRIIVYASSTVSGVYSMLFSGWVTSEKTFSSDCYAYITIAKVTETTGETADLTAFASKVKLQMNYEGQITTLGDLISTLSASLTAFEGEIETDLSNVNSNIETEIQRFNKGVAKFPVSCNRGGIFLDNTQTIGIRFDDTINYYVYTASPIEFRAGDKIYIDSGWRVLIFLYNSSTGKYTTFGTWKESDYTFEDDVKVYLEIGENPLSTSAVLDVPTVMNHVGCTAEWKKDVVNLEAAVESLVPSGADITFVLDGNSFQIKTTFNGNDTTLTGSVTQNDVDNPCFDFGAYSGGFVKTSDDDICPLNYNGSYRCAGHGNYVAYNLTAASHGKTVADIGKVYTLDNVSWVLMKVPDADHVWVVSEPNASSARPFVTTIAASGTLVNAGGNIVYTAATLTQIRPQNIKRHYYMFADDRKITANGTYTGKKIVLTEGYQSLNCVAMVAYLKAHVGSNTNSSYYADAIGGEVQYDVSYTFYGNSACVISQDITILRTYIDMSFDGITQAQKYADYAYVPFTSVSYPTTLSSSTLTLSSDVWDDSDFPPYKYYEFDTSTGIGFVVGYDISYGMGLPANRKTNISNAGNFNGSSHKMYPNFYGKGSVVPVGGKISGTAFRMPVKKSGNVCAYYWRRGDAIFVEIETFGEVYANITIPDDAVGKETKIIKKSDSVKFEDGYIANNILNVYASGVGSATIKIQ